MTYYGAKNLAESFRTVRKNTIVLAEEIPADKYDFRPAPGVRSVAEQLRHVAVQTRWNIRIHEEGLTQLMLTQRLIGIVPHLTRRREALAVQATGGRA